MSNYTSEINDYLHLSHALLYLYIAKQFTEEYDLEGEFAIRAGVRDAAWKRGLWLRNRQLKLGIKTNLENHLKYNINVMQGLSFTEKIYAQNPEEDVRDCLYCPTTKAMIARGERKLAVAYCEELHPALWESYAPGAIVNLGKTLAQEGSDRCTFCIYLRPGRMTEEQRKECFEEYDPDFKGDKGSEFRYLGRKEAAIMKSTVMLGGLYGSCIKYFPQTGQESFLKALKNLFENLAKGAYDIAQKYNVTCDKAFLEENVLFSEKMEDDGYWYEDFVEEDFRNFAAKNLYKIRENAILKQLEEIRG